MFLQSMREKTQSWVAYIIVGLLILSFALWGISSYFGGGSANPAVATVGGEKISYENFINAYHRFLQEAQTQNNAPLTPTQEQYAKQLVLKSLIERIAIIQYITKLGFAVNQQQIDAALMSVPLFSSNGEFSPALFRRFLMVNGVSAQQFIDDFAKRMTIAQWQEGISMTSFSTPLELANIISLLKQKRSIIYGVIKTSEKGLKPISSTEAEQFYHEHQRDFITPERVKIAYTSLRLSDIIKRINPTNENLIKYYTQNSTRYDVPERWQVNIIRINTTTYSAAEISQQVAMALKKDKNLSTMPQASVEQQGIWLTANNLSPEIKTALAKTKMNATTPAFKIGDNSYIVYQLLKHQSAINKQYYEVKSQVRAAYIDQEANKQWNQLLEEISNLSYEHPESLEPLAKKLNLKIQTSDFFSHDYDKKTGIESSAEIVTAAFSDDVLAGGNNSDVIKLDHGKTIYVLRVADHMAAHEQPFTTVENTIKKILQNKLAMQYAKEKAQQVQHALESNESIEKIQKAYGIILSQQTVGRFDQKIPGEVLQQAFILPLHHVGITKMNDINFAVTKVLAVIPGKMSTVSKKERAMYQNVVVNEWAQAELLAYVQSIMKTTKVKMNKEALKTNA